MYRDPTYIRKHHIKLSLNDHEAQLLEAFSALTGEQEATLVREVVIQRAIEVLHGEGHSLVAPEKTPWVNKFWRVG